MNIIGMGVEMTEPDGDAWSGFHPQQPWHLPPTEWREGK
jgi:hypothetical protein